MKRIFLFIITVCCLAVSCRTHRVTSSNLDESVVSNLNADFTDSSKHTALRSFQDFFSLDSIEIFIQKTWENSYVQKFPNKVSDESDAVIDPSVVSPSNKPDIGNRQSASVIIKAYGLSSVKSSESTDSIESFSNLTIDDTFESESREEETDSSDSVAVYNPPNVLAVVLIAFFIVTVILGLVHLFKKKVR